MNTDHPDVQQDTTQTLSEELTGAPAIPSVPEKKSSKLPGILTGAILTVAAVVGLGLFVREMFSSASTRTKAATYPAILSVLPSTTSLPPDGTFQVWVNTQNQPVSFAHVEIPFDNSKLKLTQVTVQPVLARTIVAPDVALANTDGRLVFAVAQEPKTTAPGTTGAFELARLTFTANTALINQSITLGADTKSMLVHSEATDYALTFKPAAITLNKTVTPTIGTTAIPLPTKTPTPSLAATRTPTIAPTSPSTATCPAKCASVGYSTGSCVKDQKTCQRQRGTSNSAYNATCTTRQAPLCCCK